MNIMFTKKIVAFIVALTMIIGIAMPSFAKINKNNIVSAEDIKKVLNSGGLDNDTRDTLEAVLEAMEKGIQIERGRKIYDDNEKLIDINLEEKVVKVTNLIITDEDMLLEIEYDSKNGYINVVEDVNEEDAKKVEEQIAKEQAEKEEAERLAKEQAEKEEAERKAKEQEAKEQTKESEDVEVVILNDDNKEKEISEEEATGEEQEEKETEEEVPSILEKLKGASGIFKKLLPIIQNIMKIIAQTLKKRLSQIFKVFM